jgi:hypothetical protein
MHCTKLNNISETAKKKEGKFGGFKESLYLCNVKGEIR